MDGAKRFSLCPFFYTIRIPYSRGIQVRICDSMYVRHRSRSWCEQSTGLIRPKRPHFYIAKHRISSRLLCNRECRKAACVLQSRTKNCNAILAHRICDVAQTLMVSHTYCRIFALQNAREKGFHRVKRWTKSVKFGVCLRDRFGPRRLAIQTPLGG